MTKKSKKNEERQEKLWKRFQKINWKTKQSTIWPANQSIFANQKEKQFHKFIEATLSIEMLEILV